MDLKEWKKLFKQIKKELFYKTDVPKDKIRKEWALRPNKALPTPGMYRKYSEATWFITGGATLTAMFLSASLIWMDIPGLAPPTPLNTVYQGQEIHIDSSIETHLPAWIKLATFELTAPLHSRLTPEQLFEKYPDIMQYKFYMSLMSQVHQTYLLWVRFLFISLMTAFVGYAAYCQTYRKRFLIFTEQIIQTDGAKIYEAQEAERELAKFWEPSYKFFDDSVTRFANIGENIYHPEAQRRQHTFLIGNSGSGKSQVLQDFAHASMAAGLKTVILDPGSEWTQHLFDENDPTIALIDPTDARSHVWAFMEDLKGLGYIRAFVASVIPSNGEGNKMWSNAARMVLIGLFLFLKKTIGDKCTFKDVADVIQLDDDQIIHIINRYYKHAAKLVGEIKNDELIRGETTTGIMINMMSFMEYFIDLARFWNKPSTKTISLYRFMTEKDYPIKTIIIRPNESESSMARAITASTLSYLMNFIKKPEIYKDKKLPVGNFILDEFQSPGKLEDENNNPVMQTVIQQGRKYGWGCYFATQTIAEAERIYGRETISGWRGTIGTQMLVGAPLDKDVQAAWLDAFGDKKIEKKHLSKSTATNGDVSYSENWQEHISKIMLPTTLIGKLANKDGFIKYLIVPTGAEDLFFMRKPYKEIDAKFNAFVAADEGDPTIDRKTSLVWKQANAVVKGTDVATKENSQSTLERFKELEAEGQYEESFDQDFNDHGQYADDEEQVETDGTLNNKFKKEYDITPEKEDEDSLGSDVIKDHALGVMADSHAINTLMQIWELLSKSNKKVMTTDLKEKIKFEEKKRYSQSFSGLTLKKEKETA